MCYIKLLHIYICTSETFEDICTCRKWLFTTGSDFTQGLDDPRRQPNGRRPVPCWPTSRTSHRTGRRRRRSKTRRRRMTSLWWAGIKWHKNKSDTAYMLIVAPSFFAQLHFLKILHSESSKHNKQRWNLHCIWWRLLNRYMYVLINDHTQWLWNHCFS